MSSEDCTATRFSELLAHLAFVTLIAVAAIGLRGPAPARADGDPASDVLAAQSVFIPADGRLSGAQQSEVSSLVSADARSGQKLRVAVIASPSDLGSVTAVWRQPAAYARFLGAELSLVFRGTLLIAMPNGFGVAAVGEPASAQAHLVTPPPPRPGEDLGQATITAIQKVAAAGGHNLALAAPRSAAGSGGGSALGSVDAGSWLALAAGGVLIALAWTASLRARPPRLRSAARRLSG